MTERKMTPRGFLYKASIAKSAIAFLAAQREYLSLGEMSALTSPILALVDKEELMPTPALEEIKRVAIGYIIEKGIEEGENTRTKSEGTSKPYTAIIYDQNGIIAVRLNEEKEEVELRANFDTPQSAEGWVSRRLDGVDSGYYGEITWNNIILRSTGLPMIHRIDQRNAASLLFKKKRGPVMDKPKTYSGPLGSRMKVSNKRANFSRG